MKLLSLSQQRTILNPLNHAVPPHQKNYTCPKVHWMNTSPNSASLKTVQIKWLEPWSGVIQPLPVMVSSKMFVDVCRIDSEIPDPGSWLQKSIVVGLFVEISFEKRKVLGLLRTSFMVVQTIHDMGWQALSPSHTLVLDPHSAE